jgi:uncharacterized protein (TIGR02996 family)
MRDHAPFLAAIRDNPESPSPYLIYADFLSESYDPAEVACGEFVRCECALAEEQVPEEEDRALAQRAEQLLRRCWREWVGPLCRLLDYPELNPATQIRLFGRTVKLNPEPILIKRTSFSAAPGPEADALGRRPGREAIRLDLAQGNVPLRFVGFSRGVITALGLPASHFLRAARRLFQTFPLRYLDLAYGSIAEIDQIASCRECLHLRGLTIPDIGDAATLRASPYLANLDWLEVVR